MSYLDELSRELAAVGIRGGRRSRILAEVDDHLRSGGDVAAFGSPQLVAQRFADELATVGMRRAAYWSFLALVPAALAYAPLVLLGGHSPDVTSARTLPIGLAAVAALLLAPQIACAAGTLAVLRAWHLRHAATLPVGELRVLHRRIALALTCGGLTLGALLLYAYEYSAHLGSTWAAAVLAASGAAAIPIVAAARIETRAARLRVATAGGHGDLRSDLEPVLRFVPSRLATPWRLCFAFAFLVAVVALVGGRSEGPRNAVAELVAIVVCFAAFGRRLGLRR